MSFTSPSCGCIGVKLIVQTLGRETTKKLKKSWQAKYKVENKPNWERGPDCSTLNTRTS